MGCLQGQQQTCPEPRPTREEIALGYVSLGMGPNAMGVSGGWGPLHGN